MDFREDWRRHGPSLPCWNVATAWQPYEAPELTVRGFLFAAQPLLRYIHRDLEHAGTGLRDGERARPDIAAGVGGREVAGADIDNRDETGLVDRGRCGVVRGPGKRGGDGIARGIDGDGGGLGGFAGDKACGVHDFALLLDEGDDDFVPPGKPIYQFTQLADDVAQFVEGVHGTLSLRLCELT